MINTLLQIKKFQSQSRHKNEPTAIECKCKLTRGEIAHCVDAVHRAARGAEMSAADVREGRTWSHNWILACAAQGTQQSFYMHTHKVISEGDEIIAYQHKIGHLSAQDLSVNSVTRTCRPVPRRIPP